MGKLVFSILILVFVGVSNAQQFQFTCKAFHRPSSARLEKRQNIERNSTAKHQHIIHLLEVLLSNGKINHELAPQFNFLDLTNMKIDLDGKYHIILEGSDNIGISIVEKDRFIVVDPYAKEYLEGAQPFNNNEKEASYNSLKMYNESIVEKYIEPYYFLKLMKDNPQIQEDWLAANQHGVNIIIDAWSFSRFMGLDLRSEEAEIKFLRLQEVLQHINTILNTLPKPLAFSQIKLGFDKLTCQQESIEMLKDKQICIDLHDLFWDLFPELLDTKLKNKIMRENQYMQTVFFLNSNN